MPTSNDLRPLHRRALDLAGRVVGQVHTQHLTLPTPCRGWDVGQLVGHVIGQNHGFAEAVETSDAPVEAFAQRTTAASDIAEAWRTSANRLTSAVAGAPLDRLVVLAEFSRDTRFPVADVVGFHLLDTVVHAWDIATALGEDFRPEDELVAATLDQAQRIPDGPARELPGAAFGPVLAVDVDDDWHQALALLGRK